MVETDLQELEKDTPAWHIWRAGHYKVAIEAMKAYAADKTAYLPRWLEAKQRSAPAGAFRLQIAEASDFREPDNYLNFLAAWFEHVNGKFETVRHIDRAKVPFDFLPKFDTLLIDKKVMMQAHYRSEHGFVRDVYVAHDPRTYAKSRPLAVRSTTSRKPPGLICRSSRRSTPRALNRQGFCLPEVVNLMRSKRRVEVRGG